MSHLFGHSFIWSFIHSAIGRSVTVSEWVCDWRQSIWTSNFRYVRTYLSPWLVGAVPFRHERRGSKQMSCGSQVRLHCQVVPSRLLRQTHTHANAPGSFRSLRDFLVHLLFSRNRSKSPGVFLQTANDIPSLRPVRQNIIAEVTVNVQQYQNYFRSNVVPTGSNY